MKMRWLIYNIALTVLFLYFAIGKLVYRLKKGPKRFYDIQRWTCGAYRCKPKAPGTVRIVYMCASYGEAVIASALHVRLTEARLPVEAVYTIRNRVELERFRAISGEQVLVYPFDYYLPFVRWFRRAQPDIAVFVETFLHGNMALGCSSRGVKTVAINARANSRSRFIRKAISFHYPWVVQALDWIGARSEVYFQRIVEMSPRLNRAAYPGNFKSGMPIKPLPTDQLESLGAWAKSCRFPDKLFVAGSLDSEDEMAFVLQALAEVRSYCDVSLAVAPRQITVSESFAQMARECGLTCSRRTDPSPSADVLILDTLGELAHLYRFGIGSFVGGTITGAGHNVIEPLHWGVPVAYGLVRGHFEDLQRLCEENDIGFRLSTPSELAQHWVKLAQDESYRASLRSDIEKVLAKERCGFETTVAVMEEMVSDLASRLETVVAIDSQTKIAAAGRR